MYAKQCFHLLILRSSIHIHKHLINFYTPLVQLTGACARRGGGPRGKVGGGRAGEGRVAAICRILTEVGRPTGQGMDGGVKPGEAAPRRLQFPLFISKAICGGTQRVTRTRAMDASLPYSSRATQLCFFVFQFGILGVLNNDCFCKALSNISMDHFLKPSPSLWSGLNFKSVALTCGRSCFFRTINLVISRSLNN